MSIDDDISFSLKGEKEGNLDNLVDLLTNYFMFIFGFGGELGQKVSTLVWEQHVSSPLANQIVVEIG
jgi:hypothetical protein